MSEKKVSDIILEIETKVELILGYIKNIDFTNKLILSKLSKLESVNSSGKDITPTSTMPSTPLTSAELKVVDEMELAESKFNNQLERAKNNDANAWVSSTEENLVSFKDADAISQELQKDSEPKKTRKSGKVTVEQSVFYPDGTKAVLVNVEIFNASNSLIKKSKTNSAGKWTALLDSGKYLIKLTKAPVNGKPLIQKQFEIDVVSNEQNIMELSSP